MCSELGKRASGDGGTIPPTFCNVESRRPDAPLREAEAHTSTPSAAGLTVRLPFEAATSHSQPPGRTMSFVGDEGRLGRGPQHGLADGSGMGPLVASYRRVAIATWRCVSDRDVGN